MARRTTNAAGSTNELRGDVLRVLGVLKVATADQIQRLASPHLSYRHSLKASPAKQKEARTASHRGAANDLCRHGLTVDGGRTRGGEEVRLLTAAGLAAAAIDLDREPEEMGGMPKSAGRSGAAHPMTVNETVIALIRPKPDLDLLDGEPPEALAAARAAADAPDGLGTLTSYATEVALPVKGTWKNPALGSARADIWTAEQRKAFGNDLKDPQLLIASESSNSSKSDSGPADWKPTNHAFWCTYGKDYTHIKSVFKLTTTDDEKTALTSMIDTCTN
ncbi:hypothetical protein [Streptomyces sp. 039-1]|uniref:hypothetical protein n=1 Tax=Streptomyces sp. 039-1 TaxID=2789263 RepID=UPI0039F4908E